VAKVGAPGAKIERLEVEQLAVTAVRDLHVGALRYFERSPMEASLRGVLGGPLPGTLAVVRYPAGASRELILAWRSPVETWVLTRDPAAFAALAERAAEIPAIGYLVDQTGGLALWQLTGARAADLLVRLGSVASVPLRGEARVSRIAELPVMVMNLDAGTFLLAIERVYTEHLIGWIRETLADL
jgi:sarcosine oxidase gamma subunit